VREGPRASRDTVVFTWLHMYRVGTYRSGAQPVTIGRPVVFCELPDVGLQRVAREPPIATYSVG